MIFFLFIIGIFFSSFLITSAGNNCIKISNTSSSDPWHFIVLGDTQNRGKNSSNPIRAALINSIVENNPNLRFILHTGDIVRFGGEQDDWDRYFEDIENATSKNVTFYYTVGNHDSYEYYKYFWLTSEEGWQTYLDNVELEALGNERYYSFDYNNQIHFIIINTDEYWEGGDHGTFNISAEQQSWILNDLETNSIDVVVAVFHQPSYSIRAGSRVIAAQEIRRVLEPILVDFNVDLVFSGHDHYYYRTNRSNIVHVVTGGGGGPLNPNSDTSEWQIGDVFFSEYHYCNITVREPEENLMIQLDMLTFDEKDNSTTLGDSFQIIPRPNESTTATNTTNNPFLPMMLGIAVIVLLRKLKKF